MVGSKHEKKIIRNLIVGGKCKLMKYKNNKKKICKKVGGIWEFKRIVVKVKGIWNYEEE